MFYRKAEESLLSEGFEVKQTKPQSGYLSFAGAAKGITTEHGEVVIPLRWYSILRFTESSFQPLFSGKPPPNPPRGANTEHTSFCGCFSFAGAAKGITAERREAVIRGNMYSPHSFASYHTYLPPSPLSVSHVLTPCSLSPPAGGKRGM